MSDEAPKTLGQDTVRPPEGDEDVYSASTKVGEASPEILQLVRQAEAEAALKPARVPSDPGVMARIATPTPAPEEAEPKPLPSEKPSVATSEAAAVAAKDVAEEVADVAATAPASTDEGVPVRTEQGIPPLSLLVLAIAVAIAGWLGYQALHAPPAAPSTTPPPAVGH